MPMGLSPRRKRIAETLVRRIYFDLIGLPPSPDTVKAFVNDPNPNAYEALVDRLLGSQHYGERWARHWLDVVHYADTHGYDKDKLRPNAWPYRDYVIRAFNEDKRYSRFVKEQIAGGRIVAAHDGRNYCNWVYRRGSVGFYWTRRGTRNKNRWAHLRGISTETTWSQRR